MHFYFDDFIIIKKFEMSDLKEENFVDEEEKFTNEKKISVKKKNLSVTFSPIVKIIRIESYKNYNKLIKKKNSN